MLVLCKINTGLVLLIYEDKEKTGNALLVGLKLRHSLPRLFFKGREVLFAYDSSAQPADPMAETSQWRGPQLT